VRGVNIARSGLSKTRREPVVAQTLRATAAATIAYVLAVQVSNQSTALTAPLTALLVVQVTLYATLTTGARRVGAVILGVVLAITFSSVVGLSWWSLAAVIIAALAVGRLVRVDESVNEVAISAMLVLGVTQHASQAWDRVFETLIGAGVGLLFNLVFAPPVWLDPAAESIEDLARRVRSLLVRLGEELTELPVERRVDRVEASLYEARRLDQHVAEVDEALRRAEDSLRLNPRISEGLLSRLVLRTGLDTLEICVVVVRVLTRSLTDLAKRRDQDEPLFQPDVSSGLADLFEHIGAATVSFAVLVTTQVTTSAEDAEGRLTAELAGAWSVRENVANMLLSRVQQQPDAWQLHGAMLAEVDRILDELDMEHRSRRLMEELDRASLQSRERYARLGWVGRLARGERLRLG
jgi:Aromatic acid exporter family member 1